MTHAHAPSAVHQNFACLLEQTARRFPEKPALVWNDGALTYADLDRRAGGFARHLARQGVKSGARIAVSIPNRWAFVVALLGGLKLGVTVCPLDTRLEADERAPILADLKPALVLREVTAPEGSWAAAAIDSPALVLYTSGSTGRPKGAMLSHGALAFATRSWAEPVMGLVPHDVVLAAIPLSHSLGLNAALLAPLRVGATVALVERFLPDAVRAIRQHRVTVFPGVPSMFRLLLASTFTHADLSSLRLAVSGAAACPWELAQEWRARTGVRILRGYGMTELFRPISYLADDPTDLPEATGRPVPGVEVCVMDEGGRPLPRGEVGELSVKTPAAMDGYLNSPEETRAVLVDGWFRTGDLATVTPEGFVRIEGRKRDRILRLGYSVFPQEVEAVLLSHPALAEAAVVGRRHPNLGEEVVAFVVLRPGGHAAPEELVAYCKQRLASFKYPRHVTILKRLPKDAKGKVLKARLG